MEPESFWDSLCCCCLRSFSFRSDPGTGSVVTLFQPSVPKPGRERNGFLGTFVWSLADSMWMDICLPCFLMNPAKSCLASSRHSGQVLDSRPLSPRRGQSVYDWSIGEARSVPFQPPSELGFLNLGCRKGTPEPNTQEIIAKSLALLRRHSRCSISCRKM